MKNELWTFNNYVIIKKLRNILTTLINIFSKLYTHTYKILVKILRINNTCNACKLK